MEILRSKMKLRERLAGGVRMGRAAEGRPGDRVLIKIDTRRNFVHLVSPFAFFNSRLARGRSLYTRNRHTLRNQMRQKAMLLHQSLAIAHRAVMALDEDRPLRSVFVPRGHYRSCRKRTRACRYDANRFAQIGELSKNRAQLGQVKRGPVRLDQRAVHAVSFCRSAQRDFVLHIHRF